MATNANEILGEDASDHALADIIAERVLKDAEETAPERDPATGKFKAKESEEAAVPSLSKDEADEDAAPEGASDEDETEEGEPETAIEPPQSWTAEAKEAFAKLPPDLQSYVSARESERDKGINAKLSEAAEARKKYESEAETTTQERQKYAANLQAVLQYAQVMDPIIAEGLRTDWAQESRDDPAGTQSKWFAFQQRQQVLAAIQTEARKVAEQQTKEYRDRETKKLAEAIPDFADEAKAKAKRDSYARVLIDNGFTQAEIDAIWTGPLDHRYMRILEDAAQGRALREAQKTVALKKVQAPAPKVAKPKGTDDGKPKESARITALRKQAARTNSARDISALAAALFEG